MVQTPNPTPYAGTENIVRVGTDGIARVAYVDLYGEELRYAVQNGTGWDDSFVADIGNLTDQNPGPTGRFLDMALDAMNRPRILYGDRHLGGAPVPRYAEWDGTAWTFRDVLPSGFALPIESWVALDLDSTGRPHVALSGDARVRYGYWDGTAWVRQTVESGGAGSYADINVDSADTVRIAYQGALPLGGNLTLATLNGAVWTRELVHDSPAGDARDPWIETDSQRRPHIAFDDSAVAEPIRYARWNGTGWQVEPVYDRGNPRPALALDSMDRPYIAHSRGPLIYWNGSAWRTDPVSPGFGWNPSIDVDPTTDLPVIAWGSAAGVQVAFASPSVAPGAPRNPAATGGDGQVTVTWLAPASNGGSPILTYKVFRGASAGSETFLAAPGAVLSFADMGVTNGITYWYYVTAVNEIGEGPPSPEVNATPNSAPVLSGGSVIPTSGTPSTDFVWRVTYADAEDHAPAAGEPRVYIRKAGIDIVGSPFPMAEEDPLDTVFADGKAYVYNRTLSAEGTDYAYVFAARDALGLNAVSTPSAPGPTVAVPHTPPVLAWTGEPGFVADGVDPDPGFRSTTFSFRVLYSDADGAAPTPGTPRLEVRKAGTPIAGSPFATTLASWVGAPGDYAAGAVFERNLTLSAFGSDYAHRFTGSDSRDPAGGPATVWTAGPGVADRAPTLEWTGEPGFEGDGVDPDAGDTTTTFAWRVRYADPDNDAPNAGSPAVHVLRSGVEIPGSPFAMSPVDPSDLTYSDGKLYRLASTLAVGTDYAYVVEARSLSLSATTVELAGPTVAPPPNAPPVTSLVSPVGGETWTAGTSHAIGWSMDDPDTGAPSLTAEVFLLEGATRTRLAGPSPGITSWDWVLPLREILGARIEVVVTDPGGLNASDVGGPFDIRLPPQDTTAPVARFTVTPSSPFSGDAVALDGTASTDDSGTIAGYAWSIYDTTGGLVASYSGATASHAFLTPGTYRIALNVSDAAGNWDTESREVVIVDRAPPPSDAFPWWAVGFVLLTVSVLVLLAVFVRRRRTRDPPSGSRT